MRVNKVYNRIESITGNVITVRAKDVKYKELAQISTRFGKSFYINFYKFIWMSNYIKLISFYCINVSIGIFINAFFAVFIKYIRQIESKKIFKSYPCTHMCTK